jgi:hypothetical protein
VFQPVRDARATAGGIREKYQLPEKFILWAGTDRIKRKNVVAPAAGLRPASRMKCRTALVIAGEQRWSTQAPN